MSNTVPVTPPRTWDFLLTGFLVFVELLLLVVFLFSAFAFGALNSGCTTVADACNTTRVQFGQQICTFVPPLIAALTIPVAIYRVLKRRIAFWVALLGAVLMTAAFFAGSALLQSA